MRSIRTMDEIQMRRITTALESLNALPPAERARKQYLIDALQREKGELLRYLRPARRQRLLAA